MNIQTLYTRFIDWVCSSFMLAPMRAFFHAIQELDLASEDTKVYKLIGPTLIKQDLVEAKSNVNKSLDFIKGELSRLDTRLSDYQSKASKRQQQVTQILPSHALHANFHCKKNTSALSAAGLMTDTTTKVSLQSGSSR